MLGEIVSKVLAAFVPIHPYRSIFNVVFDTMETNVPCLGLFLSNGTLCNKLLRFCCQFLRRWGLVGDDAFLLGYGRFGWWL